MRLAVSLIALLLALGAIAFVSAQALGDSLLPEWLPTELPEGGQYAGGETCVGCHSAQAGYSHTAMANALQPAAESPILASHAELSLERGAYRYRIVREGDRSVYTVTDGEAAIAVPILWSFGHGKAGQTYVFEYGDALYESRVSYYLDIDGLDWTIGAPVGSLPNSLEEAAGRRMNQEDVRGCFGCHATGVMQESVVSLEHMEPGISCEGCHGAAAQHVVAVAAGRTGEDVGIERMAGAEAERQSEFCGSCHRTWSQVVLMGVEGVNNVRFQPYRLTNSACYDTEDARIRCAACHDPHADPRRDVTFYDQKCFACHEERGQSEVAAKAPACPVEQRNCTSCHMPKYEMPGSHFAFSDHWIRVVEAGAPYPN